MEDYYRKHLVFDNGIYDLNNDTFIAKQTRIKGQIYRSDISKLKDMAIAQHLYRTFNSYQPYDFDNDKYNEMLEFLIKVFPDRQQLVEVIDILSNCLNPNHTQEHIPVILGNQNIGKTCFLRLIKRTFGTHHIEIPFRIFITKNRNNWLIYPKSLANRKLYVTDAGEMLNLGIPENLDYFLEEDTLMIPYMGKSHEVRLRSHLIIFATYIQEDFNENLMEKLQIINIPETTTNNKIKLNETMGKILDWVEPFISLLVENRKNPGQFVRDINRVSGIDSDTDSDSDNN